MSKSIFCKVCGEHKGGRTYCNKCRAAQKKQHRKENPVKAKQLQNRRYDNYRKRNPEKLKDHQRRMNVKKYGITTEEYDEVLSSQNGCCAICQEPDGTGKRRLSVDHCHYTGKIRGLLCTNCNVGIGGLEDDVPRLQTAIAYLKNASTGLVSPLRPHAKLKEHRNITELDQHMVDLVVREKEVAAIAVDATKSLAVAEKMVITSSDMYREVGEILIDAKSRFKFLDEERKVSVDLLNKEVRRINGWFRPALDAFRAIEEHLKRLMGAYVLQQRAEEARLLREAEAAAKALLATAPDVTMSKSGAIGGEGAAAVQALVTSAAAAQPAKVEGIGEKPVWTFEVTAPNLLAREFMMPDLKAIAAHIKEHGDQNVPAGVTVTADVKFRMAPVRRNA